MVAIGHESSTNLIGADQTNGAGGFVWITSPEAGWRSSRRAIVIK